MTVAQSEFGDLLNHSVARRFEYQVRNKLGRSPQLDPRIKIYMMDDRSTAALSYVDVPLRQYGRVLSALAERQPKAVFIDKVFRIPMGVDWAENFADLAAKLDFPVIAGAFSAPLAIPDNSPMPLDKEHFDLQLHVSDAAGLRSLTYLPAGERHVYGPHEQILAAFRYVGHIEVERHGMIKPFLRVSDGNFIRHWALYAADQLTFTETHALVNQQPISVNKDRSLPVNLIDTKSLLVESRRFASLVFAAEGGESIQAVDPGDVVVILPMAFTGNTDFKDTPLGRYPGGFINVSLLNSVLTGKWLMPVGNEMAMIILMVVFSGLTALMVPNRFVLLAIGAGGLSISVLGVLVFTYQGYVIPWLLPSIAAATCGGLIALFRARAREHRLSRLRHDLSGKLTPEKIERITARERLETTEQVLTIMFIDIVGFSKVADKQTPREAFAHLQQLIGEIRRTVHSFGGDVDRTMGDGMLCVFGYDVDGARGSNLHADDAVACALEIQRANVQRIAFKKDGSPAFPVRIGINTAGAFIGNLGDDFKTDLTVIGSGVNFAQRLEVACDSHKIIIGASTADLLVKIPVAEPLVRKRLVHIKHNTTVSEVFEVNPFANDQDLLAECERVHRKLLGAERVETRWPCPKNFVDIQTSHGLGKLYNFSHGGLGILLPVYLAHGVLLSLKLSSEVEGFEKDLNSLGIIPLLVEVRWARSIAEPRGYFLHGTAFKNLDTRVSEKLLTILRAGLKLRAGSSGGEAGDSAA